MSVTIEVVSRAAGPEQAPRFGDAEWFMQACHEQVLHALQDLQGGSRSEPVLHAIVIPLTPAQLLALQVIGRHGSIRSASDREPVGTVTLTVVGDDDVTEYVVDTFGSYAIRTRPLAGE